MKIILQRLQSLSDGKNTSEFARQLEMKQQTVDNYLKGNRTPNAEAIINICRKCGVTSDWLLGLVDKRDETAPAPIRREPVDKDAVIEKLATTVQLQHELIMRLEAGKGK